MLRACFIIALLLSTLATALLVGIVHAQPSVPEFTVVQVDRSYDVPVKVTYSTDPLTGEQITHTSGGYHVENITIDVIVKNQPFTSTNIDGNATQLFYAIRWKGHFENWADTYYLSGIDYNYYLNTYGVKSSNSDYTVKTYILAPLGDFPNHGQVDFQVKAQIGYSFLYFGEHPPIMPIGTNFESVEESDWSNTQTITISESQTQTPSPATTPSTASPAPASTPYNEPPQTNPEVIIGTVITAIVISAGLGFLIYLIKRK